MKIRNVLGLMALAAMFVLPAVAQYNSPGAYPAGVSGQWHGRLSPEDQREFDKYYKKWVDDTRKNDRDDLAKDVSHLQEIMARYNIPSNVPFDQVASGAYQNMPSSGTYPSGNGWQGRLSPEDQRDFDKYYSKWMDDTRRNDRDDIDSDARHMQEIMTRYNIPADVPFDQIATPGGYPSSNYPAGYSNRWQSRLSPEDQREFDKYYAKWVDDTRKNDRDDIDKDARRMQEIMARYNIPTDVPFGQIASNSAIGPESTNMGYRWQGRLSPQDQHEFDEAYAKWLHERNENDRGDMEKQARKMQDIMVRNSIPPDVPFEQIVSGGAARY